MKKILCICFALAFVVTMISCNKECVCKKSVSYLETSDTTVVDTTSTTTNIDSLMFHAGNIYDKKECEYLNISDTAFSDHSVTTLTCSMEKKDK
ncbi:MAG: hypothetical protein MJZ49_03665 [Bacteroidales bacterium]|nr:hypothetical protein [Bacteroidales bacterium]